MKGGSAYADYVKMRNCLAGNHLYCTDYYRIPDCMRGADLTDPCYEKSELSAFSDGDDEYIRVMPAAIEACMVMTQAETTGQTRFVINGNNAMVCYPLYPGREDTGHILLSFDNKKSVLTGFVTDGYSKNICILPKAESEMPEDKEISGRRYIFMLLNILKSNNIFSVNSIIRDFESKVREDTDDILVTSRILSDIVYRCLVYGDDVGTVYPEFRYYMFIDDSGRILKTPEEPDQKNMMKLFGIDIIGDAEYEQTELKSGFSLQSIFEPSQRELEKELLDLIPVLPPYYQMTREINLVGMMIKNDSTMRNFMFRGEAGTGKTEAARMIAMYMNRPYWYITCNRDTEITDLLVSIVPNFQEDKEKKRVIIPSAFDIALNPQKAFFEMTGTEKNNASERECLELLYGIYNTKTDRFRYVDSPLVKAMRYGGVIELQEPDMIQRPGVLVGLNRLFDKNGAVTLIDGNIVRRHPDTVVILTCNVGYEGSRGINQSLVSRMDMVVDFELPGETELVRRIQDASGYQNKAMIIRMISAMNDMKKICYANGVDDGSIGIRELISWRKVSRVLTNVKERARYTMLGSATADREFRRVLMNSLDKWFKD